MATIFYNETSLNGKYQVMTSLNLTGKDVTKTTTEPKGIHSHAMAVYKNLHNYWVSKEALIEIKETDGAIRTSF